MKKRIRRYYPSRKKYIFRAVTVLTIAVILFLLIDARLNPLIKAAAFTQSINIENLTINRSVSDVLSQQNVKYDDLVTVEKDPNGRVTAIKTDIVRMNSLKASIGKMIAERNADVQRKEIKIPLGTILGSDLLSGYGPMITVYISLTGSTNLTFQNIFDSAGINQTRHQIMLNVKSKSFLFLPGNKSINEFSTNICVAETIIVGLLPNTVAQLNSNNTQIPQK